MKLVKSLLLGSAAALCAVSGVQAADLPMRKAAPVEYVRVCTAFGAGFFFIPGTDTCIRVGGRARFEYQYTENRTGRDVSGFRAIGRLNLDARTQTAFGALRTFVRFDIMSRSGAYLNSGTAQRFAFAFPGLGQDTFGRTQKHVDIDKAFIQFAGITAGRASSFFDFYATDLEFINANLVSNVGATNLLAYTATFGAGFSATVSAEDPIFRRNPVFATSVPAGGFGTGSAAFTATGAQVVTLGASAFTAINGSLPGTQAFIDVAQRSRMPDFVGALRYDAAWGSAQLMGAVHEIALGAPAAGAGTIIAPATAATTPVNQTQFLTATGVGAGQFAGRVDNFSYGFAVGGGIKVNLPMIAPGDQIWLQAAYAQGANSYTGLSNPHGAELIAAGPTRASFTQVDAALDRTGRMRLTESFSVNVAGLHYWTPEIRQAVFGSYALANFDRALRGVNGPGGVLFDVDPRFRDYNSYYVGTNLAYSPVRDLDFGVEVVYQRVETTNGGNNGRIVDPNRFGAVTNAGSRLITYNGIDDNILTRIRVQRDF